MTEEPTLRLYSVTLTAWRPENDAPQVAMHNMVALLAGDGGPEEEVTRATRELFPVPMVGEIIKPFGQRLPRGCLLAPSG